MRDDYETGLKRGRSSRAIIGKIRWVLLFLVIINFVFIYKLWDQNVELNNVKTRNDEIHKEFVDVNLKQTKSERLTIDLGKQKEECEEKLAESKVLAEDQKSLGDDCQQLMDTNNIKMREMTARLEQLLKEKESANGEQETCFSELNATMELVERLKLDLIAEIESKEEAPKIEEKIEEIVKDTKESVIVRPPESNEVGKKTTNNESKTPVVNDISDNKIESIKGEKLLTEEDEIEDADEQALGVLSQCQFNEVSVTKQKLCNYNDITSSKGRWIIGHSNIINNAVDFDHDEKDVTYLFVDHTVLEQGADAGIIFAPVKSKHCIIIEMSVLTVNTGSLKIEDNNGQVFGISLDDSTKSPGWKKFNFLLKKSPFYAIKITGMVTKEGAIAISEFYITEVKCEPEDELVNGKLEDVKENIKLTDDEQDKKAIQELI